MSAGVEAAPACREGSRGSRRAEGRTGEQTERGADSQAAEKRTTILQLKWPAGTRMQFSDACGRGRRGSGSKRKDMGRGGGR